MAKKTGTVISGGFPGLVAREVQPNLKCHWCMHFSPQAGRFGVCEVGLQPATCGDGDSPQTGYAPASGPAATSDFENAPHSQAPEVEMQEAAEPLYAQVTNTKMPIKWDVLGEEHVTMVKGWAREWEDRQRALCPMHQGSGGAAQGTSHFNAGYQLCKCEPVDHGHVTKALAANLSNYAREVLDISDVHHFVDGALTGKNSFEIAVDGMRKSIYSDDWIMQFRGTPLLKEAIGLCEQELKLCEEALKRRIESNKRNKERSAALRKLEAPSYDYDAEYAKEEKIRLAKRKLALKLEQHRAGDGVAKSNGFLGTVHEADHGHYSAWSAGGSGSPVHVDVSYHPRGKAGTSIGSFNNVKDARRAARAHSAKLDVKG